MKDCSSVVMRACRRCNLWHLAFARIRRKGSIDKERRCSASRLVTEGFAHKHESKPSRKKKRFKGTHRVPVSHMPNSQSCTVRHQWNVSSHQRFSRRYVGVAFVFFTQRRAYHVLSLVWAASSTIHLKLLHNLAAFEMYLHTRVKYHGTRVPFLFLN